MFEYPEFVGRLAVSPILFTNYLQKNKVEKENPL